MPYCTCGHRVDYHDSLPPGACIDPTCACQSFTLGAEPAVPPAPQAVDLFGDVRPVTAWGRDDDG